jgi:hypothetical protein
MIHPRRYLYLFYVIHLFTIPLLNKTKAMFLFSHLYTLVRNSYQQRGLPPESKVTNSFLYVMAEDQNNSDHIILMAVLVGYAAGRFKAFWARYYSLVIVIHELYMLKRCVHIHSVTGARLVLLGTVILSSSGLAERANFSFAPVHVSWACPKFESLGLHFILGWPLPGGLAQHVCCAEPHQS